MNSRFYSLTQLSLVFTFVLITFPNYGNTNGTEIVKSDVCYTKYSHQVAEAFAQSMDRTVEPCDDFYKFSCGNWEFHNPSPKYEKKWDSRRRQYLLAETRLKEELETESTPEDILPIQNVKKLYKLCMDNETREMEGLQKIEAILRETKGWPMTMNYDAWNSSSVSWQEVESYYTNLTSRYAFFTMQFSDRTTNSAPLEFHRATFPLREETYSLRRRYTRDGIAAYRSVIKKIAQVFIRHNKANVPDEQLERDIEYLLLFEESLYMGSSEMYHYQEHYSEMNITDFMVWWNDLIKPGTSKGNIDWEPILQRLYNIANIPTTVHSKFFFQHIGYLREVVRMVRFTDERVIVNYIHWYFLSTMLPYTTEEVNDIMFENQKADLGVQERPPRWLECTRQIETDHAAAYLFGRKYYQYSSKETVEVMFRNNKAALKRQIENSNWLPVEAKKSAINKLNGLSIKSGYPDWYDNIALVEYYANFTIVGNYFENILKLKNLRSMGYLKLWGKSIPQPRWTLNILDPTSLYLYDYLLMNIPAAALQSPLLDRSLPDYVKYGTVGTLVAQEGGHFTFDEFRSGLEADAQRIRNNLMSCFLVELWEYGWSLRPNFSSEKNYGLSDYGVTLNDFISDWIGMQASLDAYKKNKNQITLDEKLKLPGFDTFTDDQMFFISYAQTHCTAEYSATYVKHFKNYGPDAYVRVNHVLHNTLEFAETFNCSKKSPMNKVDKCTI